MSRRIALVVFSLTVAAGWWATRGAEAMSGESGVYVVAQIQIEDRETYRTYEAGFGDVFEKYEGRVLSVSEDPELIEGDWPWTRTVLIHFPSSAALHAWYDSEEYQELAEHRWAASTANIVAVPAR